MTMREQTEYALTINYVVEDAESGATEVDPETEVYLDAEALRMRIGALLSEGFCLEDMSLKKSVLQVEIIASAEVDVHSVL